MSETTSYRQWTRQTDPAELAEHEAVEQWTYRTGPYGEGEYRAIVARYAWEPETWCTTVFRDEHGPLVQRAPAEDFADAQQIAEETIDEAIEGF